MANANNSQPVWEDTFLDRLDQVKAKHTKAWQKKRREALAEKEAFRKKLQSIVSAVKNFIFGG